MLTNVNIASTTLLGSVQKHSCRMLGNVCWGEDAAALARRQRAAKVGVLEALVGAMQALTWLGRPQDEGLQEQCCASLRIMCWGDDALGQARRQRAVETSLEAVATAEEIEAVATTQGMWAPVVTAEDAKGVAARVAAAVAAVMQVHP